MNSSRNLLTVTAPKEEDEEDDEETLAMVSEGTQIGLSIKPIIYYAGVGLLYTPPLFLGSFLRHGLKFYFFSNNPLALS